ncbi:PepSY-associated TM helix domain-containing protein [Dongia soli]|uniref:PepSY-associated TM helix domain-containing protein n=1 Tax=Dongia soli TaxID=600628 RepID=A0ABU5E5L7_9PROT|nr:PepSY-associated TM helix domain-containing protein [Dongia soli]MDY0881577.1 PepSY-associated TM helix domain-containing protein [Dongia soli]
MAKRETSSASSFSARRLLGQIHLWSGLILCLPLVLIGLTGSILVFQEEIDALTNPIPHAATGGEMQPIGTMIAVAEKALANSAMEGRKVVAITLPQELGEPAIIRMSAPRAGGGPGSGGQILLDPITLGVLDIRQSGDGIMQIVHRLHANLLIAGRDGRTIVGWLGVVMLVLGASGTVIWWPRNGRWRQAFMVKWGTRPLRFNRDLHGAIGIWGLAVFMVVSFSGVYLAFPQAITAGIGSIFPARDLRSQDMQLKASPIAGEVPLDIDQVIDLARQNAPSAVLRNIALPQRKDQPYRLMLAQPDQVDGTPLATLYIDPWSQKIFVNRSPADYSLGESILAWQRPLHESAGLGWIWRILVFFSGLLPLLFSVTGITMWLLKRRNRKKAENQQNKAAVAIMD